MIDPLDRNRSEPASRATSRPSQGDANYGLHTPARREIVAKVAELGSVLAGRAEQVDRAGVFPHENWADLKAAGLLGIVIPEHAGGLGGDFVGYALAAEELGRHCGATGLTFNMHVATTLLVGEIADQLDLTADERTMLEARRTLLWEGVTEHHHIHSQPFSEGIQAGATAGYATRAVPVEGGYLVTGKKIFASLAGGCDYHNVLCQVEGDERLRLLGVPHGGAGVTIVGTWDPLGMRGTDSRNLVMENVFVPADHEWLPPGVFNQAAERFPYFYLTLSFTYLGMMRGILDHTEAYLKEGGRRDHAIKQQGWAEMNIIYEQAQALCYRVLSEVGVDPTPQQVKRAWTSLYSTMEGAPAIASTAIRICGGRSMLRPSYLERVVPRCPMRGDHAALERGSCPDRTRALPLVRPSRRGVVSVHPTETQWRWVSRYAEQFRACELQPGETAVLLYEASSNPLIVNTARLALEMIGAAVAELRMPTPPNPGPLPIRSTGASQALAGHRAAVAALASADFVVDCTAEGLLHVPELSTILDGGARILMISAEHPENTERWPHDRALKAKVERGVDLMRGASAMRITSAAGTDLSIDLRGAFPRWLLRLVHRARLDRPLARRARPRLPGCQDRERLARAGDRRCQPHLQGVHPRPDHLDDRERLRHPNRRRRPRCRADAFVPRSVRRTGRLRGEPRRVGA